MDLTTELDLEPGGVGIGPSARADSGEARVSGNGDQGIPESRPYRYGHSTPWAQASLRRLGYHGV